MHSKIYHDVHKIKALDPNLGEVNWFYIITLRKNETEFKNNSYKTEAFLTVTKDSYLTEYGLNVG